GFLIFLSITILIPSIAYPVPQKIAENVLIVSRGIVLIFSLYLLFKDIENSKVYPYLEKLLPNELKTSISIALKLYPDIKTIFTKTWNDIKHDKKISVNLLMRLFDSFIQLADKYEDDLEILEPGKVYIITGKIHEGKSTLAYNTAVKLMDKNLKIGGIISKSVNKDNHRVGYEIIDLKSGKIVPLATINKPDSYSEICGPFYFYKEGMDFAFSSLNLDYLEDTNVIFIDEVGKLELNKKGFYKSIIRILNSKNHAIVLVVRNEYLDEVKRKFNLEEMRIIGKCSCQT
ncbi:MAG TPA: hypothetical protein DDX14_01350, partial [Cyanobacteria bacterium UBA9579]|nr:hypothetical protein [Cyanobacteria bacterium UBA9579]